MNHARDRGVPAGVGPEGARNRPGHRGGPVDAGGRGLRSPKVSIVICNHDYERFVADAINSALDQTYPRCEVIVVDDGSTDGSRDTIGRYADDPRVTILAQANAGQAAAMNAGFAAATGDIVAFLDADDMLKPQAIATVLSNWREGLSHCQFALETIDEDNRAIGLHPFSQRMEDGDVHWKLVIAGYFRFMPMSGNAFSREALARIFPIPAAEWRLCADAYVATMATAYGPVCSIREALALYRLHDRNNWYSDVSSPEQQDDAWKLHVRKLRSLIRFIAPRTDGEPADPRLRTARDYAALNLYRRIAAFYHLTPGLFPRSEIRATLRAARVRTLVAAIPLRHRLLYLALFLMVGGRGWLMPRAERWNAHHSRRPPWVGRAVTALKGSTFYDWMAGQPRPKDPPLVRLGETLEFGSDGAAERCLWYGWDRTDPAMNWTVGRYSGLVCRLPPETQDLTIAIELEPYVDRTLDCQALDISANGTAVLRLDIAGPTTVRFAVPRRLARARPDFELRFGFPDFVVPKLLRSGAGDFKPLAFAFKRITVSSATAEIEAARAPHAPLDRRVAISDPGADGHLTRGWHAPALGVARMSKRKAVLQMTLLNAAGFDHLVTLEFAPEDPALLRRSKLQVWANNASLGSIDTVRESQVSVLVPKGRIGADGALAIKLLGTNLISATLRGDGEGDFAAGPGLRAFTVRRVNAAASLPVFKPGEPIDFRAGGSAPRYLASGWGAAAKVGTPTTDAIASVHGLFFDREREVFLTAVVYPPVAQGLFLEQTLSIVCNGRVVAIYDISEPAEVTAVLPRGLVGEDFSLEIGFAVSVLGRPADLGADADRPPLGIGVASLQLD